MSELISQHIVIDNETVDIARLERDELSFILIYGMERIRSFLPNPNSVLSFIDQEYDLEIVHGKKLKRYLHLNSQLFGQPLEIIKKSIQADIEHKYT